MIQYDQQVRNAIRRRITPPIPLPSPQSLRRSEWSSEFERLQRNRLVMGAYRYGLLQADKKELFNRNEDIRRRLNAYIVSGNDELLVDIANMAMLEFMEGKHPRKHFRSTDDGEHTRRE